MHTDMRLLGREHRLEIIARWPQLVLKLDEQRHVAQRPGAPSSGQDAIVIDGQSHAFHAAVDGSQIHVRWAGRSFLVEMPDPRDLARRDAALGNELVAEMPGTMVRIARQQGEEVEAGEVVAIIESMKLQMNLCAPRAGRIARIAVAPNQTFDKGATLVVFEESPQEA